MRYCCPHHHCHCLRPPFGNDATKVIISKNFSIVNHSFAKTRFPLNVSMAKQKPAFRAKGGFMVRTGSLLPQADGRSGRRGANRKATQRNSRRPPTRRSVFSRPRAPVESSLRNRKTTQAQTKRGCMPSNRPPWPAARFVAVRSSPIPPLPFHCIIHGLKRGAAISAKRLRQIVKQIVDIFKPDRQTDQAVGDAELFTPFLRNGGVRHFSWQRN